MKPRLVIPLMIAILAYPAAATRAAFMKKDTTITCLDGNCRDGYTCTCLPDPGAYVIQE